MRRTGRDAMASNDERMEEPKQAAIGPLESIGLVLLFLGVILIRPFVVAWDWLLP